MLQGTKDLKVILPTGGLIYTGHKQQHNKFSQMDCEMQNNAEEANPRDREKRDRSNSFHLRQAEAPSARGAGWRVDGKEPSLLPSS